ncbi:hypothetical protein ACFLRU_05470 [Bacteroidota bacterium]
MKNFTTKVLLLFIFVSTISNAQRKRDVENEEYHRSSLHTILLETDDFPNGGKDIVISAYRKFPFPDKYNNHKLENDHFLANNYLGAKALERVAKEVKKKKRSVLGTAFLGARKPKKVKVSNEETPEIIEKYFKENKIANQMVAKWFNRDSSGGFDVSLISQRGNYDATQMDKEIAESTVRGIKAISDAGEQLIPNTFVVVSKLKYISNETAALASYLIASQAAAKLPSIGATIAQKIADKAYEKSRQGYSVWTESFLYKLKWDNDIATKFYSDYWINKGEVNKEKKEAFDNSELFDFELIGSESSKNIILFTGGKTTNTKEKIITKATVRNIEKVFAKLQKEYDVFKTKTPIISTDPIVAKIGLKEGITSKSSFEALEKRVDETTKEISYVRIGLLKVNKKKIWDNQFEADEDDKNKNAKLEGTHFKGCKKCYPGVLIRQIK